MKLSEIAKLLNGKLNGDDEEIKGINRIEKAKKGEITWLAHKRYYKWIYTTDASCIIVPYGVKANKKTIEVENTNLAIIELLTYFYPEEKEECKISNLAYIDNSVKIGKNVSVGHFCVIEKNCIISDNVKIGANSYIGKEVKIGNNTHIFPNVTVLDYVSIGNNVVIYPGAIIGSQGFAFVDVNGKRKRIPHKGSVIIEDEVEIGAQTTIDSAIVGNTVIKKGTKIDNLVHIAHNVVVDENSIIVAQVGIAGSVNIGKNVMIGGQAGITDHVEIGDNVKIGAQAGVTKDIKSNTIVSGYPAREHSISLRAYGLLHKLPELFSRIKRLEEILEQQTNTQLKKK